MFNLKESFLLSYRNQKKGCPIFPGENEQEQLAMIIEVLNIPSDDFIQQGTRYKLFFGLLKFVLVENVNEINDILEDSKGRARSLTKRRPGSRPLSQIVRTSDQHFVHFLHQCFQFVIPI